MICYAKHTTTCRNVFTLFRAPLTVWRLAALSPQLESWLGSLSRDRGSCCTTRGQAESLLEHGAYFPVRHVAGKQDAMIVDCPSRMVTALDLLNG
jgi:hypothetical protein